MARAHPIVNAGKRVRVGAVLCTLVFFAGQCLGAASVRLVVKLGRELPEKSAPVLGTLILEPRGDVSSGVERSDQRFEVAVPGEVVTQLGPGLWRVGLEAPGLWLPPTLLRVGEEAGGLEVEAWPTGSLRGRLSLPDELPNRSADDSLPVSVHFETAPDAKDLPADLGGTLKCGPEEVETEEIETEEIETEEEGNRFTCPVPAGTLDVHLSAPGTTRHYEWGVKVEPGARVDVGTVVLRHGASVVGWVEVPAGDVEATGAQVTLAPYRMGSVASSEAKERLDRLSHSATVNDRGFFEIHGVAPGQYVLTAEKPPLAPARATVEVRPDEVTEVADPPLELHTFATLKVYVEPAVAPDGTPWRIKVEAVDRGLRVLEALADGTVPAGGAWERDGVPPGRYTLRLFRDAAEGWFFDTLEVGTNPAPVFVDLPVLRVRGDLTLGDEPLVGTVWFGGEDGAVAIPLKSDEEGHYRGALPRPGPWKVEIVAGDGSLRRKLYDVEVAHDPVKGYAEVDFHLPNTLLSGVVVDEDDRPVKAIVTASGRRVSERKWTDESGEFWIAALPTGPTRVNAETSAAYSDELEVDLEDGEEREVRLVVRPQLEVRGRVVAQGRPVPGAFVLAEAVGFQGLPLFPRTTDAEGRFETRLPRNSSHFLLAVGAPGFAFRLLRLPTDVEMPITVTVSPEAGTLLLELGESLSLRDPDAPRVYLLHGGALASFPAYFHFWIGHHDVAWPAEGHGRHVLPRMEPGWYVACAVDFNRRWQLWQAPDSRAECVRGYLQASGELLLTPPGDAAAVP